MGMTTRHEALVWEASRFGMKRSEYEQFRKQVRTEPAGERLVRRPIDGVMKTVALAFNPGAQLELVRKAFIAQGDDYDPCDFTSGNKALFMALDLSQDLSDLHPDMANLYSMIRDYCEGEGEGEE